MIGRSALISGGYEIFIGCEMNEIERALELLRSGNVTIMKAASMAGVPIILFLSTGSFFQTLRKFNQNASQKESVF